MNRLASAILLVALVGVSKPLIAQEGEGTTPPGTPDRNSAANPPGPFSNVDWGFGVGIGFVDDSSGSPRVITASLDENQIVRVDERGNSSARLMLESHWFFDRTFRLFGSNVHHGPFIAISGGDNNFLDTFGAGYLFGFSKADQGTTSWNIGIGAVNDRDVQTLGDGIQPDMPLPGNETAIRFKKTDKWGAMLLFSLGFGVDRDDSRIRELSREEQRSLDRKIDLLKKEALRDAAQREYEATKKAVEEAGGKL